MSDGKEELMRYADLARSYFDREEYIEAEYFFKKLVKESPELWQAWYGRGLCLKWQGRFEHAIYCFDQVCELRPQYKKGWYNKGFCLSQVERYEDALFHINRSIRIDGSYNVAILIKAWIFHQFSDQNNPIKLVNKVLANEPDLLERLEGEISKGFPNDYQLIIDFVNELLS